MNSRPDIEPKSRREFLITSAQLIVFGLVASACNPQNADTNSSGSSNKEIALDEMSLASEVALTPQRDREELAAQKKDLDILMPRIIAAEKVLLTESPTVSIKDYDSILKIFVEQNRRTSQASNLESDSDKPVKVATFTATEVSNYPNLSGFVQCVNNIDGISVHFQADQLGTPKNMAESGAAVAVLAHEGAHAINQPCGVNIVIPNHNGIEKEVESQAQLQALNTMAALVDIENPQYQKAIRAGIIELMADILKRSYVFLVVSNPSTLLAAKREYVSKLDKRFVTKNGNIRQGTALENYYYGVKPLLNLLHQLREVPYSDEFMQLLHQVAPEKTLNPVNLSFFLNYWQIFLKQLPQA